MRRQVYRERTGEGDVNFSSSVTGGTVNYMATSVYTKDQAVVNISGQNVSGETNAYKGGGADGTVMSSVFRTTAGTAINIDTASDGKFSATAYQETASPYDSPYTGVSWTSGRAAGFTSLGLRPGDLNQAVGRQVGHQHRVTDISAGRRIPDLFSGL